MDNKPRAPETTTETYSRDWPGGKGAAIPGLSVNTHDYIDLDWKDGNIISAKYYIGGPDGILVTHLILDWIGSELQSVRRLNLNIIQNPA
jgi:hypothetical protein